MQEWLIPAQAVTLVSGLVLGVIVFLLSRETGRGFMRWWSVAAFLHAGEAFFMLLASLPGASVHVYMLVAASLEAVTVYLVLLGTILFAGRRPHRLWLLALFAAIFTAAIVHRFETNPFLDHLILSAYAAAALLYAAWGWWTMPTRREPNRLFSAVLIVFALHKGLGPFLVLDTRSFCAGQYLNTLVTVLVIVLAMSTYVRTTRRSLHESIKRFRLMIDNSTDLIYRVTLVPEPAVDFISESVRHFTGYTAKEMRADTSLFWDPFEQEDRERAQAAVAAGDIGALPTLMRWHRNDGVELWVEGVVNGIADSAGRLVALEGSFRDVTERQKSVMELRESEQRYRAIFTDAKSVMLIIDPGDGRIIDANEAAAAYYGWDRETLRGMNIDRINTLGHEAILAEMAVARAESREHFSFNHRHADGTTADVEVYSGPIHIGEKEYLLSIVHDITERRAAEAALAEERATLEERVQARTVKLTALYEDLLRANRMKDAFLANMSHELRTPLNSIIGFSGVLAQELAGPLNNEQSKQVRMIRQSGQHLLSLVNDILDFERLEAAAVEAHPIALDANDVITSVIRRLRPQCDQKGLELEFSPRCPGEIHTDRRHLEQILWNLIGNALKFTDEGRITVTTHLANGEYVIAVTDTGRGGRTRASGLAVRGVRPVARERRGQARGYRTRPCHQHETGAAPPRKHHLRERVRTRLDLLPQAAGRIGPSLTPPSVPVVSGTVGVVDRRARGGYTRVSNRIPIKRGPSSR